ncbi:hypothetical protein ESCO_001413 [Escovopsis weberi]|uniref:Uncharacterized protein n=1 Tax=Escovopsis weberi TaxID=150374 RepID=A0A0M8MTX3_ESCWE|nr:hypothetical protein ESCO_001413 [Escovopsis weberi]
MANPTADLSVYDLRGDKANWDGVGIFYVSWCVLWTVCLFSGMTFLWLNRHLPILKIRGLPLALGAIVLLHLYWILGQLTYAVGPTLPVVSAYTVQYFFMGIWFPLGIALFHASNLRFLHVAKLQRQFTSLENRPFSRHHDGNTSTTLFRRIRALPYTSKVLLFIGCAMVLQVLLTIAMWIACRKYHPAYGAPGTGLTAETIHGQLRQLSRGWEWWPSVLWQVLWTWIVAPYLIWQAWDIRDTMGWRAQTIGCCVSNLHATPMFLIALYVPAFEKINQYFSPSQWIHLSILILEILTIFVPTFEVIRLKILRKKSATLNAEWEAFSFASSSAATATDRRRHLSLSLDEKCAVIDFSEEELGDRLLTMSALNHVLCENPDPLQEFSALRDFSGENIAFLIRVAKWKHSLMDEKLSEESRRDAYNQALWIYIDFISPRDAKFPLNLSSQDLKFLENLFEQSARDLCGEALVNPAIPFDVEQPSSRTKHQDPEDRPEYIGPIPSQFDAFVFDKAQADVKYLVLTNTWPKFVTEMQLRRRSSCETGRSETTQSSQATLASRFSRRFSKLIQALI